MALDFKIRTAVPEDAEKILEFARQVGAETDYLSFGAEGLPISLEGEQAHLARIREEPRMRYILAMADDEVIGLAALESPGRERMKHRASISLSVRKKYWGQVPASWKSSQGLPGPSGWSSSHLRSWKKTGGPSGSMNGLALPPSAAWSAR